MPVVAHETPGIWLGQPAPRRPAGIPSWLSPGPGEWSPLPAARFRDDRMHAGWDRLHRMAAAGNRDALLFLTLLKSGTIARPAGYFAP
ncbi:MAG: hypothetical protein CL566_10445 [Alphaproteobacteria bacterium]|nr:hypothetical protein [Alphaproteobacteria bacterium]|tara:strand:- start:785 stop:1048 length:264 start_codon:yes stop_codon:yes gene_type:complete